MNIHVAQIAIEMLQELHPLFNTFWWHSALCGVNISPYISLFLNALKHGDECYNLNRYEVLLWIIRTESSVSIEESYLVLGVYILCRRDNRNHFHCTQKEQSTIQSKEWQRK